MKKIIIPILACIVTICVMSFQAQTGEAELAAAPDVKMVELEGFTCEDLPQTEAELKILPRDTQVKKRVYTAANGHWYLVSVVIGGQSKSSIHRPELCLPSQGFQMTKPHTMKVDGAEWRVITLAKKSAAELGFAYTFFNQEGYHTSSHVCRIWRDILDRTFKNRIDRWVMVTMTTSQTRDEAIAAFIERLKAAQ